MGFKAKGTDKIIYQESEGRQRKRAYNCALTMKDCMPENLGGEEKQECGVKSKKRLLQKGGSGQLCPLLLSHLV